MRLTLVAALLTCACDPGSALLAVSLRTDLVPGEEIDEAVLLVEDGERARIGLDAALPLLTGAAIAELPDVLSGSRQISVRLLLAGDLVIERAAIVQLDGPTAITVVVTRDCRGVDCGSGAGSLVCLGSECVDPSCSPETPAGCPPPGCTNDLECTGGSDCSAAMCQDGVCLYADSGSCGAARWCDAMRGCVGERAEPILPIEVLYSLSTDRSDPLPMQGADIGGEVVIFVEDQPHLQEVRFWIDRIEDSDPADLEEVPPWDLIATGVDAQPIQLGALPGGQHTLRVVALFDDGSEMDELRTFLSQSALDGLYWSVDGFRTNPSVVDGQTLGAPVHVFFAPGSRTAIDTVELYLDDPMMLGEPFQLEERAPYDLAGAPADRPQGPSREAREDALRAGPHEISAVVSYTNGSVPETVTATFQVR